MISKTGCLVDTNPNFINPLVYEVLGVSTNVRITNLNRDTQYYVKGFVEEDGVRKYSNNTKNFRTKAADVDYLTFVNDYNGQNTIRLIKYGSPATVTLEYTKDSGTTWTTWTSSGTLNITLEEGESVWFRGNNSTFSNDTSNFFSFDATQPFSAYGSPMTLLSKTHATNDAPPMAFYKLFYLCNNLKRHPDLEINQTLRSTSSIYSGSVYREAFRGCTGLTYIDLHWLDVISGHTCTFAYAFYGCSNVESIDFGNFKGFDRNSGWSGYHTFEYAFADCTKIKEINLRYYESGSFDGTGSANAFDRGFYACSNIEKVNLSSCDGKVLADFQYGFQNCTSLNTITTGSNLTTIDDHYYIYDQFDYCSAITKLDFSTIKDINSAFRPANNCSALKKIDLSGLEAVGYSGSIGPFERCTSLEIVDMSKLTTWDSDRMTSIMNRAFPGCSAITDIYIGATTWDADLVFKDWLKDTGATGTLHLSQQLAIGSGTGEIPLDSDSGIPVGWSYVQDLP